MEIEWGSPRVRFVSTAVRTRVCSMSDLARERVCISETLLACVFIAFLRVCLHV